MRKKKCIFFISFSIADRDGSPGISAGGCSVLADDRHEAELIVRVHNCGPPEKMIPEGGVCIAAFVGHPADCGNPKCEYAEIPRNVYISHHDLITKYQVREVDITTSPTGSVISMKLKDKERPYDA